MRHRRSGSIVWVALWVAVLTGGAIPAGRQATSLDHYSFEDERASRWKLPGRLSEVSGLAVDDRDRLFAHQDERGIVYEIDVTEGRVVREFSLGRRPVRGDFEGIAVVGDRLFMVVSGGRLYEFAEGEDDGWVDYNTYGMGLDPRCDVEGLAYEPSDRTLLLLCKQAGRREGRDYVVIYRWSLESRSLAEPQSLLIPLESFTDRIRGKSFHPSGIERHPITGNYFILAAREGAIAEVNPAGEVLSVRDLPKKLHRKSEGIAINSRLELFIADEGDGRQARLSRYIPQ